MLDTVHIFEDIDPYQQPKNGARDVMRKNGEDDYARETVWSEWRIEGLLGQGAHGKVYRVTREVYGHVSHAAAKVINIPQNEAEIDSLSSMGMDSQSIRAYYERAAHDILDEIEAMESLKGAQNIVFIEDYQLVEHTGSIGWSIWIRMELLKGLVEYQLDEGNPSVEETVKIGIDICSALRCCHEHGIVHRDVKPENVFINTFGDYKLGDFGIAKILEDNEQSIYSQKGTPMYMAPEVAKGEKYDSTADIYSLGIMLYRFLNGMRFPFTPQAPEPVTSRDMNAALARRLKGEPLPPPCNADARLARVILRACEANPSDRYATIAEMESDLRKWRLGKSDPEKSPLSPSLPYPKRFNRISALVTLALTILLLAYLSWMLNNPTNEPKVSDTSEESKDLVEETTNNKASNASSSSKSSSVVPRQEPSEYTWEELSKIADMMCDAYQDSSKQQELCEEYGLVDENSERNLISKDLILSDGRVVNCMLVDVGRRDEVVCGQNTFPAGLTFMCYGDSLIHCFDSQNGVSWTESDLREWLNTEVISMVPDELSANIVLSCKHGGSVKNLASILRERGDVSHDYDWHGPDDYLWIPSISEVGGEVNWNWLSDPTNKDEYNKLLSSEGDWFTAFATDGGSWVNNWLDAGMTGFAAGVPHETIAKGHSYWLRSLSPATQRPLIVTNDGELGVASEANEQRHVVFCFNLGIPCNSDGSDRDGVHTYPDSDDVSIPE